MTPEPRTAATLNEAESKLLGEAIKEYRKMQMGGKQHHRLNSAAERILMREFDQVQGGSMISNGSRASQRQYTAKELSSVVKVFKGALARKRFTQKKKEQGESNYFGALERRSTLERRKTFDSKQPIRSHKHVYESGAAYDGDWLGGMRHGNGTMTWQDGTKFVGKWSYNMAFGIGSYQQANGDIYTGNWARNRWNGKGKYQRTNGDMYTGYWEDDLQHG